MKYKSIVSLVPSLTELIIELGLVESMKGRTRFCIHPEKIVKNIPVVGGTKNPRLDKIINLSPDLIIANREENKKEDIESLGKQFEIILTDISTIEDALISIYEIGKKLHSVDKAKELIRLINEEIDKIPEESIIKVAYLIWRDPWMAAGHDTYINSVLSQWKMDNVFDDRDRYPKIVLDDIARKKPDYILLSSEPFPFKEKHKAEVAKNCPESQILLVEGEWFSWYGSRMLSSFKKLNTFRSAIS